MNDSSQIQELLDSLQQKTQEAKHILEVLSPLTENGNIYKNIFEEIVKQIEKSNLELKKSRTENVKYVKGLAINQKEVNDFITDSKSTIQEIKGIIATIKNIEKKALKGTETIETLHGRNKDLGKEISTKKTEISSLFKQINSISSQASKKLDEIKKDQTSSDEILKLLKTLSEQAQSNSKELDKFYKNGKESYDKIQTQSKTISNYEKLSGQNTNKIQDYFDKLISGVRGSEPIKTQIDDILKKIKSHQEQIDNQLQNAAANRLCGAFKEKEDKLKKEVNFWKNCVFAITIIIILLNIALLYFQVEFWEHLGVILPLVVLLGFAILEHHRLKQILDEYSFKYISAFSMPAYYELLESRDSENSMNFLIKTIENIYQNPSSQINSKSKSTVIDYVFDAIKYLGKPLQKNKNIIPEMRATVGEYTVEIKKDPQKNQDDGNDEINS